jgi:soluble lytic murein transglycosylase-like protein
MTLPTPLSDGDVAIYRRIFAHQKKGQWRRADREIRRLTNPLLLGHVKAQRYLHPTRYRSRYKELAGWLRHYNDHPEARRIHKLALKRKPRNARSPRSPRSPRPAYHGESGNGGFEPAVLKGLRYSRRTLAIHQRIRRLVQRDQLTQAEKYLQQQKRRLQPAHQDIAYSRIAAGWFFYGNDNKALDMADAAAKRSGRHAPFAHWYAGLAAFRLERFDEAASHFEAMADLRGLSDWHKSAAAFWAARSNLVARKPENVSKWLARAAGYPRTFYGIISRRLIGQASPFQWNEPVLEDEGDIAVALQNNHAKRALALLQIEQFHRAETELRMLTNSGGPAIRLALVAIADQVGLPAVALRAAAALDDENGKRIERGLYPVPRWTPQNGFTIDRALVFAVMRQESAFNTRARSYAGARGLMQLMPGTAGYMANKRFRGRARNKLYEPRLNMSLGQKYLGYLIRHERVDGDLFMMAAAYNGGPGNLGKWKRRIEHLTEDPLLFIESIPSRETRDFVERVLSNLWMYRERLGQRAPSLDAIAAGKRPVYKSLDRSQLADAENGRN